ncbi:MAG: hypothetical protein GY754_40940, partial [bacterium]|nr:hypothetical protein [bacterium]
HDDEHDKEEKHADSHKDEHGHDNDDHDAEDGHEEQSNVGEGKAVTKADEKLGIQLSDRALKTIGVQTRPVSKIKALKGNRYQVPAASLVYYEDKAAVYIKRDGWYTLVNCSTVTSGGKTAIISARLRRNDHLVTAGAALLRLAHLEAFGASGHGHGH